MLDNLKWPKSLKSMLPIDPNLRFLELGRLIFQKLSKAYNQDLLMLICIILKDLS
jgi:hypothetical protein